MSVHKSPWASLIKKRMLLTALISTLLSGCQQSFHTTHSPKAPPCIAEGTSRDSNQTTSGCGYRSAIDNLVAKQGAHYEVAQHAWWTIECMVQWFKMQPPPTFGASVSQELKPFFEAKRSYCLLKDAGISAFSDLANAADTDQRPSDRAFFPYSMAVFDEKGNPRNITVGDVCWGIVYGHVMPSKSKLAEYGYWKQYNGNMVRWWQSRKHLTVRAIKIEILKWNMARAESLHDQVGAKYLNEELQKTTEASP